MLPVFDTFGRHPLLIQVLAGEVAEFRDAPGDSLQGLTAGPEGARRCRQPSGTPPRRS
jgi:hypothetical protein